MTVVKGLKLRGNPFRTMAIKSPLLISSPASFRALEIFSALFIESVIDSDSNLLKDVSSV